MIEPKNAQLLNCQAVELPHRFCYFVRNCGTGGFRKTAEYSTISRNNLSE